MASELSSEIEHKIQFLRTMTDVMTEPDLDQFQLVCEHFSSPDPKLADLVLLDQLYKKFDKKRG